MKLSIASLVLALGLGVGAAVAGVDVEERLQPGALSFTGGTGFTNAVLTIVGPGDFEAEETASRGLPVFRVRGGRMKDGVYRYTLSAATDEKVKIAKPIDNGRGGNARDFALKPFHMYGMFRVVRGTIAPLDDGTPGGDGDASE